MDEWLKQIRIKKNKRAMPVLTFPAIQLLNTSVEKLISDSNSHNHIQKTIKVPILHNSKVNIDQTIRDTLSSLNYDNKDELKKQLTELKQMIESLNESNLFYNQRDEMVSLDNYESEDNQKQLLKFIDFYLK